MKKLFSYLLSILFFSGCVQTSKKIIEESCNSKLYDGDYNLTLDRECDGDSEIDYDFAKVNLNINQCNLSIITLEKAYFQTGQSIEDWKTLRGKIDANGEVKGLVYLRTLYGTEKYSNLRFSGEMKDLVFKSRYQGCNFIYKLLKINNPIVDSNLVKQDENIAPSSNAISSSLLSEFPKTQIEQEGIVKSPTIIIPTGILGDISESQKMILEKTLESQIDNYFSIVPKDLFEEAQERAFEELDYEECTEEQCIVKIQELLQIENAFKLLLIRDNNDTQISLTWNNLDEKRVEEFYCENCNTKRLRETIEGIVEKLVSNN